MAGICSDGLSQSIHCQSVEEDVTILARMLHHYDLLDDSVAMDASCSFANSGFAKVWPGGESTSMDQLAPVHRALHKNSNVVDVNFVLAICTPAVQAVAQLQKGLRPLAQGGVPFYGSTVSCDCVAEVVGKLEGKEDVTVVLIGDIGGSGAAFVKANSVAAAFTIAYYLNKTCKRQLLVGNHPVIEVEEAIWTHAAKQGLQADFAPGVEWPVLKASLSIGSPVKPLEYQQPSTEEESLRIALAKAHREMNSKGYDELTWNHMSAKLNDGFLVTPGDRLWDSIEPQDLLLESKNCTAMVLHSAIYTAMPAKAVIHTHAPCLEAVSCIQGGLKVPADSAFDGRVAYHNWAGYSDDYVECEEIIAAISKVPNCLALICRNHGAFTWGNSVEEALQWHLALEAACGTMLQATQI